MAADSAPTPLFAQRDFSALWWGQLISILGDRLNYVALVGLLAMHTHQLRDERASMLLSVLGVVMVAPVLAFSPFTGAWIDRMNIKRVMIVSDLLRCLIVLAIPVLYHATHLAAVVFALVFLMFTCNVFFLPAKSAITPEILPANQLLAANSLLALAGVAATLIGSLLGGIVVDHWSWEAAMILDGISYLISVFSLALIRYHPSPHALRPAVTLRTYLDEVGQGWKAVQRSPAVGIALASLGAVWIGGGILHVAGNPHIQRSASLPGMERLGALLACLATGGVISTLWLNGPGRRYEASRVLAAGLIASGLALMAFAVSTRFAIFASSGFVIGLCAAPVFALTETLIQQDVPLEMRGRVFSTRDFLMRLVFLVGMGFAGFATGPLGTRTVLLVGAGVTMAIGVLVLAWGRKTDASAH